MQLALWTLLFSAVLYAEGWPLSRSGNWPWLALSGILLLLGAIALGARRNLPFGGRI